MSDFGIGELAKRAGVRIDTVRYYERRGLVRPSSRRASGYRRYGSLELSRLRFIRRAQSLGLTLKETQDLLALSSRSDVAEIRRRASAKLDEIRGRILELRRVERGLKQLIEACPGHGRSADCPILGALGYEESR